MTVRQQKVRSSHKQNRGIIYVWSYKDISSLASAHVQVVSWKVWPKVTLQHVVPCFSVFVNPCQHLSHERFFHNRCYKHCHFPTSSIFWSLCTGNQSLILTKQPRLSNMSENRSGLLSSSHSNSLCSIWPPRILESTDGHAIAFWWTRIRMVFPTIVNGTQKTYTCICGAVLETIYWQKGGLWKWITFGRQATWLVVPKQGCFCYVRVYISSVRMPTGNQGLMVNHPWITALSPLLQTRQRSWLSPSMYYHVRNKIPYFYGVVWSHLIVLRCPTNQAAYLSRRSFKPFQSIAPAPSGTLTP